MNEQELNIKLAEWAGFTGVELSGNYLWGLEPGKVYKDGRVRLPVFTQSLDACFKWLVPKAIAMICQSFKVGDRQAYKILFDWWQDEIWKVQDANKEALALSRAIEKLIDSQKGDLG